VLQISDKGNYECSKFYVCHKNVLKIRVFRIKFGIIKHKVFATIYQQPNI